MKKHVKMKAGLLGEHLTHSYSPEIHRTLAGERYTYALFERAPEEVEAFIKGDTWDALNVTIPYKQTVMPYLDEITSEARRIGAVNTITRLPDGRLCGDNTDYFGFLRTVRASGVDVSAKKALVLGNGGAARTAVAVLGDLGAEVIVLARSRDAVGDIIPEPFDAAYERHKDAAVAVNCTPVGMYPRLVGQSPLSLSGLPELRVVFDMVYNPARTALLQEADALGLPGYNGLCMLVAQAKRAAELFSDEELPDAIIDPVIEEISRKTQNIILIGMPGCGKSTIGHILAETLGRRCMDTDAMVVEAAGRAIPDIFADGGEDAFRRLESEAIRAAGMMSGVVIATGGGAVTRACNLAPLSQNGKIIFLRRELDKLPTDGRPLSQAHPLSEMYASRLPLYEAFADITVDNNGYPWQAAAAILEKLGYFSD